MGKWAEVSPVPPWDWRHSKLRVLRPLAAVTCRRLPRQNYSDGVETGTYSGTASAPGSRLNEAQPLAGVDRTAGPGRIEHLAAVPL